jgi:stress response protein YsnF
MAGDQQENPRIPLAEERLVVDKRTVETGRVRIRTVVDHEHVLVQEQLRTEQVIVDRVEINQDIDVAPQVRREGDLLIIPVVEEYLFTEKRLRLKEELHVRVKQDVEPFAETVPVRRMRAVVERQVRGRETPSTGEDRHAHDHRPLR